MLHSFSRKKRTKASARWLASEPGKFHLVYSKHRETLGVNDSIRAAATEMGITTDRAMELWQGKS